FDKKLEFRSTTVENAPTALVSATVEDAKGKTDRETYRNVQTVYAEGTPQNSNESKLTVIKSSRNDDQIALRKAVEGGSGLYEEIEKITHPTSNDGADLGLLALGYARLRLATSGVPRRTVQCRVRGWGFRAGQIVTVTIPQADASGEWVIQRARLSEQDGHSLIYDLELTQSSLQQRAYESWIALVQKGKVTVVMPGSITTNLQTFNTPGTFSWVSPITGTAEFTCYGASGGGGGAGIQEIFSGNGGKGGDSGKAISIVSVVAGQTYTIVVGTAGIAGANLFNPDPRPDSGIVAGTDGTGGTRSQVLL